MACLQLCFTFYSYNVPRVLADNEDPGFDNLGVSTDVNGTVRDIDSAHQRRDLREDHDLNLVFLGKYPICTLPHRYATDKDGIPFFAPNCKRWWTMPFLCKQPYFQPINVRGRGSGTRTAHADLKDLFDHLQQQIYNLS